MSGIIAAIPRAVLEVRVSLSRIWGTARWLSYTLGVLLVFGQPVLAAPAATTSLPTLRAAQELIPNMSMVEPNLYRGGQPDLQGLQQLKAAGVQIDVCLDNERRYVERESEQAQAAGLQFVSIPLNPMHRPSDQDILRFLSIAARKDEQPVFVHCVHGRDRTGAMIAIYRMAQNHWSPDAAYGEMMSHGFRPFFTALSDAVFEFGRQLGMGGHKPGLGFIATHLGGKVAPNAALEQ